jgi:mannose-1-phosphate guanylyltransferase
VKAVLLVAGLGTRLRPLTDLTPKCLLPINGVPLLSIWLEKLSQAGVTEVLVNTHWLSEQVTEYVAEHKPVGLRVELFYEPQLLGSGGTILHNRHFFGDSPFFIIYGDNLSDIDLKDFYQAHQQHRPVITLGTFSAEFPQKCGIAEVDEQGIVQSFVEKPKHPLSNCAAAGIYVAEPAIFDYFSPMVEGQPLDLGFDVIPKLVGKMRNYSINQLIDIGTPESYRMAQS